MYERSNRLVKNKYNEYLFSAIMSSLALTLASVVDGAIVGNLLGDTALAAVGLASPLVYGINILQMLFCVGGVTCASIASGKREGKSANHFFTLSLLVGTVLFILYAVAVLLFIDPITFALAQNDMALQELAKAYITPLLFLGPFLLFDLTLAQFWRLDGNAKAAAIIPIVANVVNLIFDYVSIRFLNMGIAGAGFSTTLGYVIGFALVLPYLFSKKRTFRFSLPRGGELRKLLEIIKVGSSKALGQGMSLLRSLVLNMIVMFSLGSLGMSTMTVCLNATMITGVFISGTSDALLPIVGTLFGERDSFGIRAAVKTAYRVLIVSCFAVMVFFLLAPQMVGGWFGINSPEALAVLNPALRLYALSLPFFGINQLLQNFYATTGRAKLASVMAILDGFIFVVSFALLFMLINGNLLWLGYLCAELCTLTVVLITGAVLRRKKAVSRFLLLEENTGIVAEWDTTIAATVKDATGLSAAVIDFCKEKGLSQTAANRIGIAIEEMAVNTSVYNEGEKKATIDVLVRMDEEFLVLRFRDDGKAFDPTVFQEGETFHVEGMELLKKIECKVDYARQLGMNTAMLQFERKNLPV